MIYNLPRKKKKGETWVINEHFSIQPNAVVVSISFSSNSEDFSSFSCIKKAIGGSIKYGDKTVCTISIGTEDYEGTWDNSAYRIIVLSSPATGDLLTWLQANAIKQ